NVAGCALAPGYLRARLRQFPLTRPQHYLRAATQSPYPCRAARCELAEMQRRASRCSDQRAARCCKRYRRDVRLQKSSAARIRTTRTQPVPLVLPAAQAPGQFEPAAGRESLRAAHPLEEDRRGGGKLPVWLQNYPRRRARLPRVAHRALERSAESKHLQAR